MAAVVQPLIGRMERVEEKQEAQELMIGSLSRESVRLSTEIEDHKATDTERFDDLKAICASIQKHIVELPVAIMTLIRNGSK